MNKIENCQDVFRKYPRVAEHTAPFFYADLVDNKLSFSAHPKLMDVQHLLAWGMMYNPATHDTKILFQTVKCFDYPDLIGGAMLEGFRKFAFLMSGNNLLYVQQHQEKAFRGFDVVIKTDKNMYMSDYHGGAVEFVNYKTWNTGAEILHQGIHRSHVFVLADETGNLCHPEDLKDYVFLPYVDEYKFKK